MRNELKVVKSHLGLQAWDSVKLDLGSWEGIKEERMNLQWIWTGEIVYGS